VGRIVLQLALPRSMRVAVVSIVHRRDAYHTLRSDGRVRRMLRERPRSM